MPTVYLLFPDRNAAARDAALLGIERAFENARVKTATSVDEVVLQSSVQAPLLLVLVQPQVGELELALKIGLEEGLARSPVVSLGGDVHSSGLAVIPPEDWHGPLLAQVFRAALQTHELKRENARLRGDLLTFARRVSHDLRTPLSGVFTTAELLKEILTEHSAEDAALTTPLFDSTQSVLKLIERVSQVARATVEPQPKEMLDMGLVAWAGRQSVEQMAMKAGVKFLEPEQWPQMAGVSSWLEVVWANLLSQGVQRSTRGNVVEMQWQELAEAFEFSVRDHGPALKDEQRAALFWPFEKLHQSHSAKGLELPIVRRLVELQGGRCRCEVPEDGGLRLCFTLPKEPLASAPVE